MNYITLSIILLTIVFGLPYVKNKFIQLRQRRKFILLFKNHPITMPALKFGYSYSWPTFVVTFTNYTDYEYAKKNQLFTTFKNEIQSFYSADFNSDLAVSFTYK
jgi:hypothetical protein